MVTRRLPPRPTDPPEPPEPTIRPTRPPRPPQPLPPQPPPPPGQTPSITSWSRLEPHCRDADMQRSLAARIHDPLWLLTRQWQVGEFQGEDAGSPVVARTRARSAQLSRLHLGVLPPNTRTQGAAYDCARMPLEVVVERRPMRSTGVADARQLRLAVDAGLHFLRMLEPELERQSLSRGYRDAFVVCYALAMPDAGAMATMDSDTARFLRSMAGRAVDARRLAAAFRPSGGGVPALDPALQIAPQDRAEIEATAANWLAWYDGLFSEPSGAAQDAWIPERLEYALSVAARLSAEPGDEKTLTAAEMYDGHLDWSDFDLNLEVAMGTQDDRAFASLVQTSIPAPVSFRGTPAARFWEFEDARIEYGLLPVGPSDLAQLMMIEYTSSYGNDWFVVPLELLVGSVTTIDSLVVTDTFGVRTLLRPLGDRALGPANWSMFQHSYLRTAGSDLNGVESNLFFLAPALARSLQSAPVEDVLFMRDEMANIAWAIERSIESPLGQALSRSDASLAQFESVPVAGAASGLPRYLLSSRVPAHWIPLLPVQRAGPGGTVLSLLQRGAVLQPDGSRKIQPALGTLLNLADPLLLHDEEVPREGARVTRHYQLARWIDGSTFAWMAHRKQVGRGEGSSGLRFDSLAPENRPPR